MVNLNLRVFRRNVKNLIVLWSSRNLTDDQRENTRVYAVEANAYRELTWRPFVPDNPDKFAPDVVGVVIGHSGNKLDSAEPCTVRFMLGVDNVIEIEKNVDPASQAGPADFPSSTPASSTHATVAGSRTINVRLYALDELSGNWVPVPLGSLPALKLESILLKEND